MSSPAAALPTVEAIAAEIDHAILKPEFTRAQVDAELALARQYSLFSVCVRPSDIAYVSRELLGSGVLTGTVIGFPHGTTSTAAKVAEARQALADGAHELDMVLNVGALKSGFAAEVEADIAAVVAAAEGTLVKVILEVSSLTEDEIRTACVLSENAGADFVKTSTGFAAGGATAEAIALMRHSVSPKVAVKASGGIRDLDTLLALRALGASRFGTSASAIILDDLRQRLETGVATGAQGSIAY